MADRQPELTPAAADAVSAEPHGTATTTMPPPLDFERIRQTPLHRVPWTHAVIDDTFTEGMAQTLTDTFPTTGFTAVDHHGEDKQFTNEVRNDVHSPNLTPAWLALLQQINSDAYRAALTDLTGLELAEAVVRPAFWRYGPDCWLSPHPDDDSKIVSHVMYFNTDWPADAGGNLLVHGSADVTDVHHTVAPVAGTSLIIVRSPASWHSVERVTPEHRRRRQSMTVVFHKPGYDLSYYGY
jgi:SM-20-related protein